jgi:cell wall-associated NlpC family hydrolase
MEKAVCNLSVIPVRAMPSEKSEMTTQLLFGETCEVIDNVKNWSLIRTHFDQYEGWCSKNQLQLVHDNFIDMLANEWTTVTSKTAVIQQEMQAEQILSFGSSIPDNWITAKSTIKIISGEARSYIQHLNTANLIEDAFKFMGAPYLWGGRSIFGIDCSGFIQLVFKANGVALPRDASQQVGLGSTINFIEEAQPGDLLFFDNEEGKIVHVGMLISGNNVIHASGFVRTDMADHHGIFNDQQKKYSHKLRIIKRITL